MQARMKNMADTSARTLRLLSLLESRRYWPGAELAERLQVSARTLRRDVDRLRELGYPIQAQRGVDGGYQLAHADLRELARNLLGRSLGQHRQRIFVWAEEYRQLGWPSQTPEYLLRGYFRMLDDLGDLPEALARSRSAGLAHADDLARIHGPRLGLDFTTCYDYLTRVLSYDLGETEIAGLACFARWAARLGLAPEGVSLVFHRGRDLAPSR